MTPVREAAEIALKLLELSKRTDWDSFHFQTSALKQEFEALVKEHKITAEQIHAELGTMKST